MWIFGFPPLGGDFTQHPPLEGILKPPALRVVDDFMQLANAELEKRVEERTHELKLRTQELERNNEELNQFTYVASHDLQEPVRNLISYSVLLTEDLGNNLPDDVSEDLHHITRAASRMQQLIQDLLRLSRAGHSNLKTELIALDDCVDCALDALRVQGAVDPRIRAQ